MSEFTPTVVIAVCAVFTLILSCAVACTRMFMSKLNDVTTVTKSDINALGQAVDRDLKVLDNKIDNHAGLIKALEHKSDDKESRLLRVEMAVENFKDGQERLREEVKDSRMHLEMKLDKKFDQLAESIREMQMKPRPRS